MNKNLDKMIITVKDYPDEGNDLIERIWVKDLGKNLYEIDNIPFYAYGISLGDTCLAKRNSDGELVFNSIMKKSGHSTVRVFTQNESFIDTTDHKLILDLGCSIETVSPKYICIDVPNDKVILDKIITVLKKGEERGDWDYEESDLNK